MNTKNNAFAGVIDGVGAGIDALFADDGKQATYEIMISLEDIEIEAQIREEFEDDEHTLASLGKSLRNRQIQAIVVRPNRAGRDKPYLLVAGERRVRGGLLEGLTQLRAIVMDLEEDEAEDAQLAENIHRLNLSQIEEAKKIQRDLDKLGSVEAVLEKHHKSRAWLSKILSLLNLPDQAKRLVKENISADLEVITAVKTIEKVDPVKAKALVDDLKTSRGKAKARDKVAAVKQEVKPSKKPIVSKKEGGGVPAAPQIHGDDTPGKVIFAHAKIEAAGGDSLDPLNEDTRHYVSQLLDKAYTDIYEGRAEAEATLNAMNSNDKEMVEAWLYEFFTTGKGAKDVSRAVIQGFRNGLFGVNGVGAFALIAFLQGADIKGKFFLVNIFGGVKS